MDNNKILQKVQMKIAISNVKEEDIVMNKRKLGFSKRVGLAACIILSMTGMVFATKLTQHYVETTPAALTPINSLNIKFESPKVGDEVTFETKPTVIIDDNENYTLNHTAFIDELSTQIPGYDEPSRIRTRLKGTVEKDKDYIVEITLKSKDGFAFIKDNNITLKINGETTKYETDEYPIWSDEDGSTFFMFFVKIRATEN